MILIEKNKIQIFDNKLNYKLTEYHDVLQNLNPNLRNIQYLEHMIEYLKIIDDIQEIK